MEPEIITVETIPAHIQLLVDAMRPESAEAARRYGMTPKKALWNSYRKSFICKSVFINGKIGAIFGICGMMFGQTAHPWLILASEADDYPMRVAFAYRRELNAMSEIFPELVDYVPEDNKKAVRMLELMGFDFEDSLFQCGEARLRRAVRRA